MTVADRDLFAWRMRGWREQAWGNSLRAADEYPACWRWSRQKWPRRREPHGRSNRVSKPTTRGTDPTGAGTGRWSSRV